MGVRTTLHETVLETVEVRTTLHDTVLGGSGDCAEATGDLFIHLSFVLETLGACVWAPGFVQEHLAFVQGYLEFVWEILGVRAKDTWGYLCCGTWHSIWC